MIQYGTMDNRKNPHLIRYVVAWVPMPFIAIANGVLRQFTFGKVMPELRAHQLSTVIGAAVIGLFIRGVVRIWPPASKRQALSIGFVWLALTIAFEFFLGRFVMQRHWSQMLNDYNVLKGRVWAVFLVWLTLAPYTFSRFRGDC